MSEFGVLFLNAGRRVELIQAYRRALERLGLAGQIVASDIQPLAPALYLADQRVLLPQRDAADFTDRLLALCRDLSIKLIVPTIDPDLSLLASLSATLRTEGVFALIASPESVQSCNDKVATDRVLAKHGLPRAAVVHDRSAIDWSRGVFLKPRTGSASIGARKVAAVADLPESLGDSLILQEFCEGAEVTIDVFCDTESRVRATIPRERVKVRAGEVSVARILKDAELQDIAARAARAIGLIGPANIQIIRTDQGPKIIEVNARYGGGSPLSIAAGVPMPEWTIEMALSQPLSPMIEEPDYDLVMLRYDQSVFVRSPELVS